MRREAHTAAHEWFERSAAQALGRRATEVVVELEHEGLSARCVPVGSSQASAGSEQITLVVTQQGTVKAVMQARPD